MDGKIERGALEALEDERRSSKVDELTTKDPKIAKPTCPICGADPLVLKRLRYDFPDGVVVEVLFCGAKDSDGEYTCRAALGAQIVGLERIKPPR
jgi:hypothetical protein